MEIKIVPLAGLIFGLLIFDTRWQDDPDNSYFELTICLALIGIRIKWFD